MLTRIYVGEIKSKYPCLYENKHEHETRPYLGRLIKNVDRDTLITMKTTICPFIKGFQSIGGQFA